MKIAISQPTYLPWQGYFALIDYVDEFVFLENIQFNKRSWQQKNKINSNGKELILTIPVKTKSKFYQKICDVEIADFNKIKKKHILSIKNAYSKSKYFNQYIDGFEKIYDTDYLKLSELNKDIIKYICKTLKIKTKISSDQTYSFTTKKIEYLKDVCKIKNSENYISTLGSKDYFGNIIYFPDTKIKIDYYDFKDKSYNINSEIFISKLSIIDLLFNLGPNSLKYLRNNFFICN